MSTNTLILVCFIVGCTTALVIVCEICDCIKDMHRTDVAANMKIDKEK